MAGYQSHFTGVEGLKVAIKHKCRLKSAKRQNNTSLHSKGFDPCWWFRTSYEVGHTVCVSWHAQQDSTASKIWKLANNLLCWTSRRALDGISALLSYEASLNASQRGWSPRGTLWKIPATCGRMCMCRPASPVLVVFGWVYEWFVGILPLAIDTVNTNDTVRTFLRFQTAVHAPIKYVKHVSNEPH